MDAMAHIGWCHNGDIEWRYDSWAVGSEDYTRAAAPPITREDPTIAIRGRVRRIPRRVFWAGLLLMAGIANYEYDTKNPPPAPEKPWQCDFTGLKCVNWRQE
jgi:hypothetical protein